MNNSLKLAAMVLAVSATTASAQGRGRKTDGVPPGMRPSAGMCRVWVNGVPPGQQSGVTDCATAQAQVRANSRVLYGSNTNTSNVLNRTYTRRRQLADGSWVLERFRRDAAGNVTVVSSQAITRNPNGTWNDRRRDGDDDNDVNKAQRKTDKHEWKNEKKMEKKEGKKDKDENDDEDNG